MGQYYLPIIRRTTAKGRTRNESIDSFDFHNGLKLMEHSWVGNNFVNKEYEKARERHSRALCINN